MVVRQESVLRSGGWEHFIQLGLGSHAQQRAGIPHPTREAESTSAGLHITLHSSILCKGTSVSRTHPSWFTLMSRQSCCFCLDFWQMCFGRSNSPRSGKNLPAFVTALLQPLCWREPWIFAIDVGIVLPLLWLPALTALVSSVVEYIHMVQPISRTSSHETKTMDSYLFISSPSYSWKPPF